MVVLPTPDGPQAPTIITSSDSKSNNEFMFLMWSSIPTKSAKSVDDVEISLLETSLTIFSIIFASSDLAKIDNTIITTHKTRY